MSDMLQLAVWIHNTQEMMLLVASHIGVLNHLRQAVQLVVRSQGRLVQKIGFQSALSGRLIIAQQFTAGIDARENVVRAADG